MTHGEQATALLLLLADDPHLSPLVIAQAATAHATMALAEAVDGWKPPDPEKPSVPFEQTREGWRWDEDSPVTDVPRG